MKSLVGRAELVVLSATWNPSALLRNSSLAGYYVKAKPKKPVLSKTNPTSQEPSEILVQTAPVINKEVKKPREHAAFLRISGYHHIPESERQVDEPQWVQTQQPFSDQDLTAPETVRPPMKTPLMPWSHMDPILRSALGTMRRSVAIDMSKLMAWIAQARPIVQLPRRVRRTWARQAHLLIDRDVRLVPFWEDQSQVYQRLIKQRGQDGLSVFLFDEGPTSRVWQQSRNPRLCSQYPLPPSGTPVLLLGDCGYLKTGSSIGSFHTPSKLSPKDGERRRAGRDPVFAAWKRLGEKLLRRGCRPIVLTPCPRWRWPVTLSPGWWPVCWDRKEKRPLLDDRVLLRVGSFQPSVDHEDLEISRGERLQRQKSQARFLLTLLSVAVRIEPALLRDARLLLAANTADVGTEADAWHHGMVKDSTDIGIALAPEQARIARSDLAKSIANIHGEREAAERQVFPGIFLRKPRRIAHQIHRLLMHHHQHLPRGILLEERMNLFEIDPRVLDQEALIKSIQKLAVTMKMHPTIGRADWVDRMVQRLSEEARQKLPELAAVWAYTRQFRGDIGQCPVPAGWDAKDLAWCYQQTVYRWHVWQHGPGIYLMPPREFANQNLPGSPLNQVIETHTTRVQVDQGHSQEGFQEPVKGVNFTLPLKPVRIPENSLGIQTEWETLTFEEIEKPPWAEEIGRDRFGLYVDLSYKDVVQRLRWINPGRFRMGSPATEPGRWEDEVEHWVTLSKGFWLADTPCTQALWEAVMGTNPSFFRSPTRPVEQVSWEDCQEFLARINGMEGTPGVNLRFPTEAEWEYACRAGTTGALYSGSIELLGQRNAPALDSIAWYGGNSGKDFELDNGFDFASWKEKQYDHTRAGTHPVKQKAPNPWRLWDMLGNVWEWCADGQMDFSGEDEEDPLHEKNSAERVLRGGSWRNFARFVRCASRYWYGPGDRDDSIGFRFARGQ